MIAMPRAACTVSMRSSATCGMIPTYCRISSSAMVRRWLAAICNKSGAKNVVGTGPCLVSPGARGQIDNMSAPDSDPPKPRRSPTGQPVGPSIYKVPPGDDRERLVCAECGFIHYENPKIVVGSVIEHEGRVVLCRRAIHPRRGYWTLPAGYLESRETVTDGARREALEEACAE